MIADKFCPKDPRQHFHLHTDFVLPLIRYSSISFSISVVEVGFSRLKNNARFLSDQIGFLEAISRKPENHAKVASTPRARPGRAGAAAIVVIIKIHSYTLRVRYGTMITNAARGPGNGFLLNVTTRNSIAWVVFKTQAVHIVITVSSRICATTRSSAT